MYSCQLRSFLLMIFEGRDLKRAPVSFEEMLEHEFLINFHGSDEELNPELYMFGDSDPKRNVQNSESDK